MERRLLCRDPHLNPRQPAAPTGPRGLFGDRTVSPLFREPRSLPSPRFCRLPPSPRTRAEAGSPGAGPDRPAAVRHADHGLDPCLPRRHPALDRRFCIIAAGAGAAGHRHRALQRQGEPNPSATTHNTLIEVVWTVLPILILVIIAIPSFSVLTDQLTMPDGERKYLGSNIFSFGEVEVPAPAMTIKATGVQWNWELRVLRADGCSCRCTPLRLPRPCRSRITAVDAHERRLPPSKPEPAAPAGGRQRDRRAGQHHRPHAGDCRTRPA